LKVRDLIRQLENDGWRLARTRGSHRQFRHASKPGTVTVPAKQASTFLSELSTPFSSKQA
jgi:predicted RNA binding protein YcfA (HicA-like mRNA interferase family)